MSCSSKTWTSSNGVKIGIAPFFDSGYKLRRLEMTQIVGGILGSGKISLYHDGSDEAMKLITDQYQIQISLEQEPDEKGQKIGVIYEIEGFINLKKPNKNSLDLEFLCVPGKDFFTTTEILEWPDITTALQSLWTGKLDIRCDSDINNSVKLWQSGESKYSLMTKLAYAYKKKSVFCFGLEGFMIKDLIGTDSTGNSEPYWTLLGESVVSQTEPVHLNYNYKVYKENKDPWEEDYSSEMSENLRVQVLDGQYQIIHKDYYQLLDNWTWNKNMMGSTLYNSFTVVQPNQLPQFKIGDTIKYKKCSDGTWRPWTTFFVSRQDFFIAVEKDKDQNGLDFSVTSVLRGLEEGGSMFPESDPADK